MKNIDRQNEFIDMLPEFDRKTPGRVVSAREFPGAQVCFLMGWKEGYVAMPHADGTYPALDGGWGEYEIMGIYNESGETWTLIECHDYKGLLEGETVRAFRSSESTTVTSQADNGAVLLFNHTYGEFSSIYVSLETLERLEKKREEANKAPEVGTLLRLGNTSGIYIMIDSKNARNVVTGNTFEYETLRTANGGKSLVVAEWPKAH